MKAKNEFLREKPTRTRVNFFIDFSFFIICFLVVVVGLFWTTHLFAKLMNYDPRLMGKRLFTIFAKRFYSPFRYLGLFLKYFLRKDFEPYFWQSMPPALFSLVLTAVLILFYSIFRSCYAKAKNLYGTARWATEKDLKKFGLLSKTGVVLGQINSANISGTIDSKSNSIKLGSKSEKSLICHSGKTNTLLLAPTRSGKGGAVVIPSLLNYTGSVIVFDPKGENWNITAGFRKKFSHVLKFAPLSEHTIRFNPLNEIRKGNRAFSDADQIASIIFSPGDAKSAEGGTEKFFNDSAKALVTGVLLHVRFSKDIDDNERNFAKVLRLMSGGASNPLTEEESENIIEALFEEMRNTDHGDQVLDERITAITHRVAENPKERASVFSTAFSKLQLFEDPLLANATSTSDFSLSDFITQKNPISLYLVVPFSDVDRIAPVFKLLITFMLRKFSEGETQHGEMKLKNHLLFLIDEFRTLGYFPFLPLTMGILAGYGITFLIVVQALNQISDIYGKDHPFLDHCKNMVVFAPGKVDDAEMFSKMVGKESVVHDNLSASGKRFNTSLDNVNIASQEVARDLINPDELLKLPANQMLVLNHGMPAYIGKKVFFYEDSRFQSKAFLGAPKTRKELLKEVQGLNSNKGRNLFKEKKKSEPKRIIKNKKDDKYYFDLLPDEKNSFFTEPDPDMVELKNRINEGILDGAF